MTEYTEKRHFPRAEARCRIRCTPVESGPCQEGVCLNISAAGIVFQTNQAMEVGRAAELRTYPDNPATPPLTAYVEILRCKGLAHRGFQIAAAIRAIKAE
jgi:hypothetical protein